MSFFDPDLVIFYVVSCLFVFQAKKNGAGGEKGGFLSTVRSISDIGKSFSHGKNLSKIEEKPEGPVTTQTAGAPSGSANQLTLPTVRQIPL